MKMFLMRQSTAALFALTLLVTGCANGPRFLDVRCNGAPATETALYFGLSGPAGPISEGDWNAFRRDVLVPAFSEGFTVIGGDGFWRSSKTGEAASEPSKVVIRIHEKTRDDEAEIADVIATYKKDFQQESVLRVDTPVCATF